MATVPLALLSAEEDGAADEARGGERERLG